MVTLIGIPYIDQPNMMIDCINSIVETTKKNSVYLLFIDNGSQITTRRLIQNHLTMRTCYHYMKFNNSNIGVPKSWNQMIDVFLENDLDKFDLEYLCILNNDVICQPPFRKRCSENGENPPRSENGKNPPIPFFKGYDWHSKKHSLEKSVPIGLSWLDELIAAIKETKSDIAFSSSKGNCAAIQNYDPKKERFYISKDEELTGYCFLMTKDTIKKYGKFNESYGIGLFEETEYVHNIRKNGGKAVIANHSYVQHLGSKTFNDIMTLTEYCRLFEVNKHLFKKGVAKTEE